MYNLYMKLYFKLDVQLCLRERIRLSKKLYVETMCGAICKALFEAVY